MSYSEAQIVSAVGSREFVKQEGLLVNNLRIHVAERTRSMRAGEERAVSSARGLPMPQIGGNGQAGFLFVVFRVAGTAVVKGEIFSARSRNAVDAVTVAIPARAVWRENDALPIPIFQIARSG